MTIMQDISKSNIKIKSKRLYGLFERSIKQIISELKLVNPRIKIDVNETETIGVNYDAEIESAVMRASFSILTETKNNDLDKFDRIHLSIEINDRSRPSPYYYGEWLRYEPNISKWITKFFHKRNLEMQDGLGGLRYITSGYRLKFIGDWGVSSPSANFLEIMLTGAVKCGYSSYNKIPVLRIRHLDGDYRAFSYVIMLEGSAFVFPDFCGLDSGEAGRAYDKVERIIEREKKKLSLYDLDVDYNRFKEFAEEHLEGFKKDLNENMPMLFKMNKEIEDQILEELDTLYPDTMRATELSTKVGINIDELRNYIFDLKKRGLLEETDKTFGDIFVRLTDRLERLNGKTRENVNQPIRIRNYGTLSIVTGNQNTNFGNITGLRNEFQLVKKEINSSDIEQSLKNQILEKLDELEKEIRKPRPNRGKINRSKTWFEKLKEKLPDEAIIYTITKIIDEFFKKYISP